MLRRPYPTRTTPDAPSPAPTLDLEVVNVTRLEVVLDTGLPLSFDLEKSADHSFTADENFFVVILGARHISIATKRILYYETRPHQIRRTQTPVTSEVFAALQQ